MLHGEKIAVDSYGFRDRSWGPRSQFGVRASTVAGQRGGYSYATASANDAFHTITMDFGQGCISIHGYLVRDGEWAKLASAHRDVLERDAHRLPDARRASKVSTRSAASWWPRAVA